jgi:hypothetical protein
VIVDVKRNADIITRTQIGEGERTIRYERMGRSATFCNKTVSTYGAGAIDSISTADIARWEHANVDHPGSVGIADRMNSGVVRVGG